MHAHSNRGAVTMVNLPTATARLLTSIEKVGRILLLTRYTFTVPLVYTYLTCPGILYYLIADINCLRLFLGQINNNKDHTCKALPRRHTWAKFSKSNIPLSGVGNFNGTASMVSMVSGPGK